MARYASTVDAARGGRRSGGGALSGVTPGRFRCRENVRCAEDARVNIGAGLFGDGDVPAPPWTSRPWIDAIDPRGAVSGHARPSLGARRSTRPAVRVSGVLTERGFSQQPLQLRLSFNGGAARRKRTIWFQKRTFTFGTRFRRQLERRRGQTRNSALRWGAKLGETNERARFVEGRQAGPRATRGARGTHATACLVRLHHRDVFGIVRRKVRPVTTDATDRTADPCPSAALPTPVCQRGN